MAAMHGGSRSTTRAQPPASMIIVVILMADTRDTRELVGNDADDDDDDTTTGKICCIEYFLLTMNESAWPLGLATNAVRETGVTSEFGRAPIGGGDCALFCCMGVWYGECTRHEFIESGTTLQMHAHVSRFVLSPCNQRFLLISCNSIDVNNALPTIPDTIALPATIMRCTEVSIAKMNDDGCTANSGPHSRSWLHVMMVLCAVLPDSATAQSVPHSVPEEMIDGRYTSTTLKIGDTLPSA